MESKKSTISIIGGGLAGSECALQLAEMGYEIDLYEMRKSNTHTTPAHKTSNLSELVCSNSFGNLSDASAPGQLKWEAEKLNSFILKAAKEAAVPAGQALGVDRVVFSEIIDKKVKEHPRIQIKADEVKSLNDIPRPTVVATGPLTSLSLSQSMAEHFGDDFLYFFDAIAPILDADSIDMTKCWKADRWGKGTNDYINCPLNKDEYDRFVTEVNGARKIEPKDFEKDIPYFESCMPIEEMIRRGPETPRFGCMTPKGLPYPGTDKWPHAVVQLRQDNKSGTAFNMVGFQTKMAYSEQKRIFKMIPGLENADFLKLGSIHKNLYINSPKRLNHDLSSVKDPLLFFAGQITGVEGYFESTCIGLLVSRFLDQKLQDLLIQYPPNESAMGALLNAITQEDKDNFQPTNINFGLFPPVEMKKKNKKLKREMILDRAKLCFSQFVETQSIFPVQSKSVSRAKETRI